MNKQSLNEQSLLRLRGLKASLIIAFMAGVVLSPSLWITGDRLFPVIKPFDFIPALAAPAGTLLVVCVLVSAALWIFYERRILGILVIAGLVLLLLQDQMRWQPWVYLYLLMLCPFAVRFGKPKNDEAVMLTLQLLIAGVYLWSGLHKCNRNFADLTFMQLSEGFGIPPDKRIACLFPLMEICIALALLLPAFRKAGLILAVLMHLGILLFLSPMVLRHNSIVYPWNLEMIVLLLLLFAGHRGKPLHEIRKLTWHGAFLLPVLLVWGFPVLNLMGYWDHYLSFSLYSDKPPKYYIAVEETELHKLGQRYSAYFADIEGLQGGQVIDLDKWAFAELNVPFYPQMRFFRKFGSRFCRLGIADGKLVFLESEAVNGQLQFRQYSCREL